MRKLLALILAAMLIASMAVTASACTPRLKTPSIQIPKIKTVPVTLPQSFWDNWFAEHPVVTDLSGRD